MSILVIGAVSPARKGTARAVAVLDGIPRFLMSLRAFHRNDVLDLFLERNKLRQLARFRARIFKGTEKKVFAVATRGITHTSILRTLACFNPSSRYQQAVVKLFDTIRAIRVNLLTQNL